MDDIRAGKGGNGRRHRSGMAAMLAGVAVAAVSGVGRADERCDGPPSSLVFVLDYSRSMWAPVDDHGVSRTRYEILRDEFRRLVSELPDRTEIAVIAYGHRNRGSCDSIETVVDSGPKSTVAARIDDQLKRLLPIGTTPITDALLRANDLARPHHAKVVLISDGKDPCSASGAYAAAGTVALVDIIGFRASRESLPELACFTQRSHGKLFDAYSREDLRAAMRSATCLDRPPPPARLGWSAIVGPQHLPVPPAGGSVLKATLVPEPESPATPATRDGTGVFEVPPGHYRLVVTAASGSNGPPHEQWVDLVPGDNKPVVVELGASHLTMTAAGTGAANETGLRWTVRRTDSSVAARGTGRAVKAVLEPGDYRISLEANGGPPQLRDVHLAVEGDAAVTFTVDQPNGRLMVSAAIDGWNVPAELDALQREIELLVYRIEPAGSVVEHYRGARALDISLPPGRYRVAASWGLAPITSQDFEVAGNETVAVNYRFCAPVVRHRVINADGAPIAPAKAAALHWRLIPANPAASPRPWTGDDIRVRPGFYTLEATMGTGQPPLLSQTLEAKPNATTVATVLYREE